MSNQATDSGVHKYQSQWKAYQKRRASLAVLVGVEFLALIPFMTLVEPLLRAVLSNDKLAFLATILLFAALYLFTVSRLRSFACPRCGENFFGGAFVSRITPRAVLGRCANCGLRKYEGE